MEPKVFNEARGSPIIASSSVTHRVGPLVVFVGNDRLLCLPWSGGCLRCSAWIVTLVLIGKAYTIVSLLRGLISTLAIRKESLLRECFCLLSHPSLAHWASFACICV